MANSFLVVSHKNAVKLGLASEDGAALEHTCTLQEIKALAQYDREQLYQAKELANEMGGAWIVDESGDTEWYEPRALPEVQP